MKAQVKKTIASHLVRAMPVAGAPPHDAPNLLADIKLDVFRDGYEGSVAEQRRLEDIIYEMHREAHKYEV